MRAAFLILFLFTIFPWRASFAQNNDAQLWSCISISKRITKDLTGSLEQQVRLNHNMSYPKNIFTEARIGYRLNKMFKYTLSYRFMNRGNEEFGGFVMGNRLTGDLRIRVKKKPVTFTYRNRMQREYRVDELGYREINYNRNKLALEFDLDKKFAPYISFELYYHMNEQEFDKNRYTLGIDYDINKRSDLSVFYRLQQDYNVNNPFMQYIIGLGYSYSLKGRLIKKKKETEKKED